MNFKSLPRLHPGFAYEFVPPGGGELFRHPVMVWLARLQCSVHEYVMRKFCFRHGPPLQLKLSVLFNFCGTREVVGNSWG